MVNGVAQVNVFGSQKHAVRIDVDPRALAARSIGIDEVATAIQNANANLPTGTIYGERTFVVQTNGQLMRASAYGRRSCPTGRQPGAPGEVAHVYDGVENDKTASWQNGERCVYLSIRSSRASTSCRRWTRSRCCPAIRAQLPASVTLDVRSDRASPSASRWTT